MVSLADALMNPHRDYLAAANAHVIDKIRADALNYFAERELVKVEKFHPIMLRTRPMTVEAAQVTAENLTDVAWWCQGRVVHHMHSTEIGLYHTPTDLFDTAKVGDWIVRDQYNDFLVVPEKEIVARYDRLIPVVSE